MLYRHVWILLGALALLGWAAGAPAGYSIGTNFTGNNLADAAALNGFGFAPPDTDGFVGNTQFVQFTNGQFTVYNKADGSLAAPKISDTTFWNNAGAPAALVNQGLTDTRVIFDPQSQRWYAAEITFGNAQGYNNSVLIAVSNTADATQGFKSVSFAANSGAAGFGDFTQFGLNADGVYIDLNDFKKSGALNQSIFAIPKSSLLAATPSTTGMTSFYNTSSNTVGFTVQPAIDFGPSNGHESLLAVSNQFYSQLVRTNIITPPTPGVAFALSTPTVVQVGTTNTVGEGRQPDGTQQIDNGDDRFSGNVYKVGNLLYAAHSVEVNGFDAIRWYVLNEVTNAVKEGTISSPIFDYYYPSIAANANGDVVIGFSRSGTAADALGPGFISAFAEVGSTDASGNLSFGGPILLKAGLANYHLFGGDGERWGDYSATSVDPTNPNAFWTTQEFAGLNNNWETQVTEIFITPSVVPEPASILMSVIGLAGAAFFGRRRARVVRP